MNTLTQRRTRRSRREGSDGLALWITLAAGLLILLAAAIGRAEPSGFSATRTDHFNATLAPGSTLRIENVSGDIVASSGRTFSAVVTITVSAPSQERADDLLKESRIAQAQEGEEYSLETRWPEAHHGRSRRTGKERRSSETRCDECKINARYDVVVPSGTNAVLTTINGEVRTKELDGDLEVKTVNGSVTVRGARKSIAAESVNGKIDVIADASSGSSSLELKTVNGGITLTLPKDSKFDVAASTMTGTIASTFPLPARPEAEADDQGARRAPSAPAAPPAPPAPPRRVVVKEVEDEEIRVDLRELERELSESMKLVDDEVRRSLDAHRELRKVYRLGPGGHYTGSIGQGGTRVRLSTLNGAIVLLASGTKESDAKLLASPRRSWMITVPRVKVAVPRVVVHPHSMTAPSPPDVIVHGSEDHVVRGDIAGDFFSTSGGGSYQLGKVSGKVKILTHAGEIHVASAGGDADLKTYGGDIAIGPVHGDLKAHTLAGDVSAGVISGSTSIETSGGDIHLDRVGGSADLRTGGGDIALSSVGGGLKAETSGGDVRATIASREAKGGVAIHSSGGDVTLTLPADFHGDIDLEVSGCSESDGRAIHSDFPEISIARRAGVERASGTLNGGGSRVVVRTTSGSIRLRRGGAAS